MTAGEVSAGGPIDAFRLAGLLIRFRLRSMRNTIRVRRRGLFATIVGVATAFAYVGLFAQAFTVITRTVALPGQLAALVLVTGTIAFGSLAARAASSEAVRAGTPENEFYLARPVSLPAMVVARGLADAVTDPVGALFLLPVLISATAVWNLSGAAWAMAVLISLLAQVAISMLAYSVQLAVVRYVPGARRRAVWTALRLVAAMSLATLWMMGTWVMRAPAALAIRAASLAPVVKFSPAMLVSAPLAALAQGRPGQAVALLAALAVAVAATMLLVVAFARRAGMVGWEEAGAVWAEATAGPSPASRLPTAATKDLRLIVRDRSQLLALIAMPVIFIGVQIFGAAGWSWTTANLVRVSCFAYSLALYMATIGPLTHMQAERRAFWILRSVPVPLGSLLAAKARAWAVIVGGIAAVVYIALSLSLTAVPISVRLLTGVLVTAGAAGMSFVAVAMASGGADLSDETSNAVGPSTIYAYLFVGSLFNVVLVEDSWTRVAGLILYGLAGWAYWQAGVEHAGFCMDAEAVRARRVRAADGMTMLIVSALGGRALLTGGKNLGVDSLHAMYGQSGLVIAVGIAAAIYLARRPRPVPRLGAIASLLIAVGAGALATGTVLAADRHAVLPPVVGLGAIGALAEEAVLRGIVQRALPVPRFVAAAIAFAAGVVSAQLGSSVLATGGAVLLAVLATHAAAAIVYAFTGRAAASWLARIVMLLALASL